MACNARKTKKLLHSSNYLSHLPLRIMTAISASVCRLLSWSSRLHITVFSTGRLLDSYSRICAEVYLLGCWHRTIQGDSGGICNTLGNDCMCDSKQKSSYEHGSDFARGWMLSSVATVVNYVHSKVFLTVFHISKTWWFTLCITMHVMLGVMLFIT
jgi:hypothetical protein